MCRDELLNEGGTLSILGYFALGFDFNFKEAEVAAMGAVHYNKYYEVIEKYFDCDRVELSKGYKNYPILNFFPNAQKFETVEKIECNVDGFVKYCKT